MRCRAVELSYQHVTWCCSSSLVRLPYRARHRVNNKKTHTPSPSAIVIYTFSGSISTSCTPAVKGTLDSIDSPCATTMPSALASASPARDLSHEDEQRAARSLSPSLPVPPIPDAPGPRAQALINAFEKALDNTLRRCNYENFAACFPTPAQYRGETLDQFWREFVGRLEGFCKV